MERLEGMIRDKIQHVNENIAVAAGQRLLAGFPIKLMGASKTQPPIIISEAIQAGLLLYGENRVEEAADKWPALRASFPHVRVEMIGPLQSKKAKEAVALFDRIQSVDRLSLIEALAKEMQKQGRQVPILIQVNTGEEPQKGGVIPADAHALIKSAQAYGLTVEGLMCIPPADANPAPHFALLRQMAAEHGLPELSMGMSGDFEEAIKFGATIVRVGSAIFGERT